MTMSDPIADMLTRIRNANTAKHDTVEIPASKMKTAIAEILLKEGFIDMDMAQNILVIRTVSGMAMAVCAALDALKLDEIVGSIAGDDTIMCAVRTVKDTTIVMNKLRKLIKI